MQVYPRVCGGTILLGGAAEYGDGLSPRVRGNLESSPNCSALTRSIPACAGEPRGWATWPTLHTVYPRVCGGTLWQRGI